jgi:hypothetical protein
MCGGDGREDLEFRLLHVYRSAKRAWNQVLAKGEGDEEEDTEQGTAVQPKAKARKRSRTDPPEDLVVVDSVITNGDRDGVKNTSDPSSGRVSIPISKRKRDKRARERISGWQQEQDPQRPIPSGEDSAPDVPVAVLTPRLRITSTPAKWRSLAVRILECSERPDADQSCYGAVLAFLKDEKGHRIIPEHLGRRSNGKKRQLNEALDVLWASSSTFASDGGNQSDGQDLEEEVDSDPTEEEEPPPIEPPHQPATGATVPITSRSSSAAPSLLLVRTRKPSSKKKLLLEQSTQDKKPPRRRQDKPPAKRRDPYESDDGSLVF